MDVKLNACDVRKSVFQSVSKLFKALSLKTSYENARKWNLRTSNFLLIYFKPKISNNKGAQRALSRSTKEKVKGHSGAIYRGPLMLSIKYW